MRIDFCKTLDSDNIINKKIDFVTSLEVKLKKDFDLLNPTILLSKKGLDDLDVNYCYIEKLKRYYFIRNVENINKEINRYILECDVLETNKEIILNSECSYSRKIRENDYQVINPEKDVRKEIQTYENNFRLKPSDNMVFSTIGG